MPKLEGVYEDARGKWYFKVTLGYDPLTRKRVQVTKRGFATATEAAKARRKYIEKASGQQVVSGTTDLTVDDLLDLYLDGLDADERLARKTRFDYRSYADAYVRPLLGKRRLKEVTPEVVIAWQRRLADSGGTKKGQELSANTVRLARAPLAGAFRLAVTTGVIDFNPLTSTPSSRRRKGIPKHWSPEQAREFLKALEGDRGYVLWAFLMSSGLRIGELVWLRWSNVDLRRKFVRVVDFAATLGWEVVESDGKSTDAVRTIDLDDEMVRLLHQQAEMQNTERTSTTGYMASDYVFTKPGGGDFHPQTLSKRLARTSTQVGLPRLTAHGLRHTCATLMLDNGVPPKVAAERLGHADPTLFMNLYSHVTQTMQSEAAALIGSALFGATDDETEAASA